jgi:hypothetical protein
VQTDPEWQPENETMKRVETPKVMGNMQAYFRSSDYQLGDFFRATCVGFGVELTADASAS